MKELNSGCMPNTGYQYEQFENLLASLYHVAKEEYEPTSNEFLEVQKVINELTNQYKLQSPKETIQNPRTNLKLVKPDYSLTIAAIRDFGIRPDTEEFANIQKLERLV